MFVWLERHADDQLYALRQRGEELSDVILRLAGIEAAKPGRKRGKAQPSDADAARPASVDTSA